MGHKWLDKGVALLNETKRKEKPSRDDIRKTFKFELEFTDNRIKEIEQELTELKKDRATYLKFLDITRDKTFKNQREFAQYILSLDKDIMSDYVRVYGVEKE